MAVQDAKKVQYGKRKLGQAAWEEQQAKNKVSHRPSTAYGPRKAGAKRSPSSADTTVREQQPTTAAADARGETNPFLTGAGDRITISQLGVVLEEQPGLLDVAIEAELAHKDKPRKGALELLKKLENTRATGPREGVVKLIDRELEKLDAD
jgi:hypothetical protein